MYLPLKQMAGPLVSIKTRWVHKISCLHEIKHEIDITGACAMNVQNSYICLLDDLAGHWIKHDVTCDDNIHSGMSSNPTAQVDCRVFLGVVDRPLQIVSAPLYGPRPLKSTGRHGAF